MAGRSHIHWVLKHSVRVNIVILSFIHRRLVFSVLSDFPEFYRIRIKSGRAPAPSGGRAQLPKKSFIGYQTGTLQSYNHDAGQQNLVAATLVFENNV